MFKDDADPTMKWRKQIHSSSQSVSWFCIFLSDTGCKGLWLEAKQRELMLQELFGGTFFFLLLLFGCFFFFFNLKSLYWPQISFHAYFFFSLSLRCWLQGTRNKGHLMSWGRRWWRCCHGCWTDRAQEINSVNRVWAKTIKSVVLVSPYGAECCHAQAAGQLASCAGLRSPLLHKPVCFSHFQRQALRQTEKLFSSLQLQ